MKKALCLIIAVLLTVLSVGCKEKIQATETPNMEVVFAFMSEYLPSTPPLTAKKASDSYGIDPDSCIQEVVLSHRDKTCTVELWMIEAVDEAAAKTIRGLAEKRVDSMREQFRGKDEPAF